MFEKEKDILKNLKFKHQTMILTLCLICITFIVGGFIYEVIILGVFLGSDILAFDIISGLVGTVVWTYIFLFLVKEMRKKKE